MKKSMKQFPAMLLAVASLFMMGVNGLAEEAAEPAPAPAPQVEAPKAEEPKAPKAEEPKAEAKEEAPVTIEIADEPKAEAPAEAAPAEGESDNVVIEVQADPTAAPVEFTGSVKIELKNEGDIFYGDEIVLKAVVENANLPYTLRWEVLRDTKVGWENTGEDSSTYKYEVTEANAAYGYRVVLTVKA